MKVALMRRIFERADDLVIAMEARAFRKDRTDPRLTARKCDWLALLLVGCLCIVLMVLS